MSVLGYNTLPFLGQQIHCYPNSYKLIEGDVYRWIYSNFDVKFSGVSWLTPDDFTKIYHKVVYFGQSVKVECLLKHPTRFMIKKLQLQIAMVNRFLNIRLLSECIVDRIDVREDPFRPDHRLCRWPKPLDLRTHVINTDGSLKGDRAAIGWIFRTAQGCPSQAYSALCQKMPVYVIEVWAMREAFRYAQGNIRFVVAEADATIAISLINTIAASFTNLVSTCQYNGRNYLEASTRQSIRGTSPREDDKLEDFVRSVIISHAQRTQGVDNSSLDFLIKALVDVTYYLEKFEGWGCKHVMREANRAADFLTKLATEEAVHLVKSDDYPEELWRIIEEDADDDMWYQRKKRTPVKNNFNESSGWRLL